MQVGRPPGGRPRLGCLSVAAGGTFTLFAISSAGTVAARAVKGHMHKQKLKTAPICLDCDGAGNIKCDICADARVIECKNEVYIRTTQVVVCPVCAGKGHRQCPNCYGEGAATI